MSAYYFFQGPAILSQKHMSNLRSSPERPFPSAVSRTAARVGRVTPRAPSGRVHPGTIKPQSRQKTPVLVLNQGSSRQTVKLFTTLHPAPPAERGSMNRSIVTRPTGVMMCPRERFEDRPLLRVTDPRSAIRASFPPSIKPPSRHKTPAIKANRA